MLRIPTLLITLCSFTPVAAAQPPHPSPPHHDVDVDQHHHRQERFLQVLRERDPERHQELMHLRESDPDAFRAVMGRLARYAQAMSSRPGSAERLQVMLELDYRIHKLALGWDELSRSERSARRAEMRELTEQLFELRQAQRRERLAEMSTRLEQLSAEIEERERGRDEIIDHFLDDLVGEGLPGL